MQAFNILEKNSPDRIIAETIQTLNTEFFDAIHGEPCALSTFMQAFSTFSDELELSKDSLMEETLLAAYEFSVTVKTVVSSFLELDASGDVLAEEITSEVSSVLAGMNELSLEDSYILTSQEHILDVNVSLPYVKVAYEWLLSNLHNPYPSKEVRSQIALAHDISRKLVDGWFVDIRKRIGWNSLCKAHFKSSRKSMISAATTFFNGTPIPSTSTQPYNFSPFGADLGGVFITLENRAKGLYSTTLGPSSESDAQVLCRGRKRSKVCDGEQPTKRKRQVSRIYPSPPTSAHGSPEPSSPLPEISREREEFVAPSAWADVTYQPLSPASTMDPHPPSPTVPSSHVSQTLSSKRKRSSSCAEREEVPISKRVRRSVSAPIAHVAHVPAFDSWPCMGEIESFDFSVGTPASVEAVPLAENVEWDTSNFENLIAALQREDTPELSDAGSSPYSAASPGLADSPTDFLPNLDFTTYPDPSNQALLSVETSPLIFYNGYNNTPDSSTDIFSTLLQTSGQYDISLTPLDIMPNSWLLPVDHGHLNTWSLQPTDKGLSSFGNQSAFCQPASPTDDERMAKLLRAQQLREELRKLEQDI